MYGEMVLKQSEMMALGGEGSAENSANQGRQRVRRRVTSFGAIGFLTIMIAVAAILFSSGNLVPAALSQRLMEETDVQYADLVESKKIVLQQALRDGELPDDTARILKENGYSVGYVGEDGVFVEDNKAGRALVLLHEGEIITAEDFVTRMGTDPGLYAAVQAATYDRAAAYYDEAATDVFTELGTNRHNFSAEEEFEQTMQRVMGNGSNVSVGSAQVTEQAEDDGEISFQIAANGDATKAGNDVGKFIEEVRLKNSAATATESAVNAGDALKVADQLAQEQRSALFYALMMENISKMKAGEGNDSKLNETMNYLTRSAEVEVVDTVTGEKITVSGSALEAPSLYAILAGEKVDHERVRNYSAERVLETIKNRTAAEGYSAVEGTVASVTKKAQGSVGRLIGDGTSVAAPEDLASVEPTLRYSLVENGVNSLQGIALGEFLADGAVNLGRMLARKSGATPGDDAAVQTYARLNQSVLAMEAEVDRMSRSPLDITSKNTFLGSILYNLAMVQVKNPEMRSLGAMVRNFNGTVAAAVKGLWPKSWAAATDSYMTDLGTCETAGSVGAAATASCWEIATFDPSTLMDTFNDPGFKQFVEENTELSANGVRKVIPGSDLANFITYLVGRKTPIGVMDGGILESMMNGGDDIPFVSDILAMMADFLGANEEELRMASGETFVNKAGNPDWEKMKYAQRYVALARVTEMLKEHSSDATAYRAMKYFEGEENPVMAFLRQYQDDIAVRE